MYVVMLVIPGVVCVIPGLNLAVVDGASAADDDCMRMPFECLSFIVARV
jgi:hypothetical protein